MVAHSVGGIWGGKFDIWEEIMYYTPIWDVLAPQGERVGAGEQRAMRPRSLTSKLGRWCQLGLLGVVFAAGLVGVGFSWKKVCIWLDTMYIHTI